MPAKLTDAEKKRRGTFRKDRAVAPRSLTEIRTDITKATERLEEAQRLAKLALATLEREGITVSTGRGAKSKHKNHPALKARKEQLIRAKSAQRELELLREEEGIALDAPQPEKIGPLRAGLLAMSYSEAKAAQPPLNADEWDVVMFRETMEPECDLMVAAREADTKKKRKAA